MWKVYKDFNNSFTIDEDELEKAIYSFITGKPVVFKSGAAVRHIESIMPDYYATMGWNEGYKMTADDWAYINSKNVKNMLSEAYRDKTQRVQYLIESKQERLIGTGADLSTGKLPERLTA